MVETIKKLMFKGFSDDLDTHRRLGLIYLFVPIPIIIITGAIILSIRSGQEGIFTLLFVLYLLLLLTVVPLLRLTKNIKLTENFLVFLAIPIQLSRLILGGEPKVALFLIIPWAVFTFFMVGRKLGLFWVGLLVSVSLLLAALGQVGVLSIGYTVPELLQIYVFLAITIIILYLYDRRRELFQNIAYRERAKARSEEARLRLLLESMSDGVVAIDRNWNITLWNKAMAKISGWPEATVMGQPLREYLQIFQEDTMEENITFIEDAMVKGKAQHIEGINFLRTKQGKEVAVADSAAPVFDSSGTTNGAIIVLQDMSEAKRLSVTKTEIISTMAHQVRTPLNVTKWHLELLESEAGQLTKKQQKLLDTVVQANQRAIELVKELLAASRAELGTFFVNLLPVDFLAVSRDVLDEFRPLAKQKDITITEEHDDLPFITADENLLRFIYRVLVTNAIKYTPEKGSVHISQHIDNDAHEIIIAVSDTGFGIGKEDGKQMFTKLFRSKKALQHDPAGFGLALFTVKKMIESAGGRIWFASPSELKSTREHPGTTFYVAFPLGGMKVKADQSASDSP